MMQSVEGIYRDGRIELLEEPPKASGTRVIVTFLSTSRRGKPPELTPEELAELRGKFASWEEDWNAPGMEAYDACYNHPDICPNHQSQNASL